MRQLPHRIVGPLFALGLVGIAVPAVPRLAPVPLEHADLESAPTAHETAVATPLPDDIERVVASDMVVDWVGAPPEGAAEALLASPAPADHRAPAEGTEHHAAAEPLDDGVQHHAAASGGYALFSHTARWVPGGYTIRLTGGDGRIEQYRDEIHAAASAAARLTGVPFHVATTFGGPIDPARGEIAVVLGGGPCGGNAVGCGGPTLSPREVLAGRIWLQPAALGISAAQRAGLAAHELGHALGLQHYDGSWTDGRQVMYPTLSEVTSYRNGDASGLRVVAGSTDQPAGSVASLTYAAGRALVSGTVSSGSRVRISAGSRAIEAATSGGRFSAALPLGPGSHVVCTTVLDAGAGFRRDLGCAALHAPGQPVGRLGRVTGSFETISVRGWAIDPQTADAVRVQIRRNGELVGTVAADRERGDLGQRATQYGVAHGIDAEVPAVGGRNRICVRVLGVGPGGDLDLGCAEVVHAVDPVGALDVVRVDGPGVGVDGWALDPNTPDPISVVVHVDGEVAPVAGTATASGDRPDVAVHHPAHGAGHGYSHWVPVTPGRHTVCVAAVNVGLGQDRPLGCAEVEIRDPAAPTVALAGSLTTVARDLLAGS